MRPRWLAGWALAAGCLPSNFFPIEGTAAEPGSSGESPGSTGAPVLPTTSGSTDSTGSTGSTGDATTTAEDGTTGAETTGTSTQEPLGPPAIIKVTFTPDPVTAAGAVGVVVETAHADGVTMAGLSDTPIGLVEDRPQKFVDETSIAIVSAEANEEQHCGTFTPWRDGAPGAAEVACFTVQLPPGGTETYWEGAPDKGTGSIAALATLPDGHVVEFGTYYLNNQARCYLRLRDEGGAWGADDFVDSFVAETCTATDMAVTDKGELYLLANVTTNGDTRWWLGLMAGWKGATKKVGGGIAGATGRALAREKDGERVAVCGTYPTQAPDITDAAVWFFQQGKPGLNRQFDHVPADEKVHSMRETPFDCAFVGSDLVLAGEARGKHPGEEVVRRRHFLLEYGSGWPDGHYSVAGPDKGIESGASALAIDGDGNSITAGYRCGDPCDEVPELRAFAPGGQQIGHTTLPSNLLTPLDLAYSPADYVVLTTGTAPDPSLFVVQAWRVGEKTAVWPYEHKGAPSSEVGTAVTIGPFGQVYAGGISAAGYPAIVFIAP
jgi:hypothetical protein